MQLEGIVTRPHDVPGVRRKLPAPFTRDVIDLDGGKRVKRAWRDIKILDVQAGDTVANFGRVTSTVEIMNVPTAEQILVEHVPLVWKVRLHNVLDEFQDFPAEQRVYAFCPELSDE